MTEPAIIELDEFVVVGILYRGDNKQGEIPALWQRFGPRMQGILGRRNPEVSYGVMDHFDQEAGVFDYLAAVEVSGEASILEDM